MTKFLALGYDCDHVLHPAFGHLCARSNAHRLHILSVDLVPRCIPGCCNWPCET